MFGWAMSFLIVTLVASIFGFAGLEGPTARIARTLFLFGLIVFLGLVLAGSRWTRR